MVVTVKQERPEARKKTGTILMDAPAHQSMQELAYLVGGQTSAEERDREKGSGRNTA